MTSDFNDNLGTTDLMLVPYKDMGGSSDSQFKPATTLKIVLGNQETTNTIAIEWDALTKGIHAIMTTQKNESLLIEVVRNFIRKMNFSELNESLNENQIDEKYYNNELEKNGFKYAIPLRNLKYPADAIFIKNLVYKIGSDLREFSVGEVSEMFSVKQSDLINQLTLFEK